MPDPTSRRRRCCSGRLAGYLTVFVGLLMVLYQILWTYYLPGVLVSDMERINGHMVARRKPNQLYKTFQGEKIPNTPVDGILEGVLTLIDVELSERPTATFCQISWDRQNHHAVSSFKELQEESFLCDSTRVTVALNDIVYKARLYDDNAEDFAVSRPKHGVQGYAEPSLFIFHQSKSGATGAANALSAFSPQHTRVYSESPVLRKALEASSPMTLLQDLVYLMGRTVRSSWPQYVFYKFRSDTNMELLAKAFPETPWVFIYRQPVEILMSYFKLYQHKQVAPKNYNLFCNKDTSLDREDACAKYLSEIAERAIRLHESSKAKHWLVNYDSLPYIVWETILPELMVGVLPSDEIQRMHEFAKIEAHTDHHFKEDGTLKRERAPPSILDAANEYMNTAYNHLVAISGGN